MRKFLVCLSLVILFGCEKEDKIESPEIESIIQMAYSKDYYYPDNFYHEKNLDGYVYYENTVSILPTDERKDIWIELSIDDKSQAKEWSVLSNEYSSVNREIIVESETEKYFQYKKVNVENDNDILLSRVHKLSYFQSLYNKFSAIDTVGIYYGELTMENVKELIEYLWSCETLGYAHKVIESNISENDESYIQVIESLVLIIGDWGIPNMINIYENTFQFDKSTRILTVKIEKTDTIEAYYD